MNFGADKYEGAVGSVLQAGDANMDLKFDQLDLVQVQIAAKYLDRPSRDMGRGGLERGTGRLARAVRRQATTGLTSWTSLQP